MERKFKFSIDEYYHLYNRGVNKSVIFNSDSDRDRFVKLLFISNSSKPVVFKSIRDVPLEQVDRGETLVDIGAYCLMPNHFHLLLREKKEGGITSFLSKLLTGYSMYFNKRYERTGRLFESSFKATYVDSDEYLKYLFAYVHLNPVKIIDSRWKERGILNLDAAQEYINKYRYSSYLDYTSTGCRSESILLNKESFPAYFTEPKDFKHFINDWLDFHNIE